MSIESEPGPGPLPTAVQKTPRKPRKPKVSANGGDGAESTKVARPRLQKYPEEHVITVRKENAKRLKAAERFQKYHTGMTVKSYLETMRELDRTDGQTFADMRWDVNHGFIAIGPTVVDTSTSDPAPTAT